MTHRRSEVAWKLATISSARMCEPRYTLPASWRTNSRRPPLGRRRPATTRFGVMLGILGLWAGASSCQSKTDSQSSQATPTAAPVASPAPTPTVAPVASPAPTPAAAPATASPLLDAYDAVRAKLADDQLPGDTAASLAQQATAAGADAVHAAATQLQTIQDIEAARKQFGEVSRALIERLRSAPPEGVYLYECPMAQGYGKWLQKQQPMANPYMGKRMLECGASSEW